MYQDLQSYKTQEIFFEVSGKMYLDKAYYSVNEFLENPRTVTNLDQIVYVFTVYISTVLLYIDEWLYFIFTFYYCIIALEFDNYYCFCTVGVY